MMLSIVKEIFGIKPPPPKPFDEERIRYIVNVTMRNREGYLLRSGCKWDEFSLENIVRNFMAAKGLDRSREDMIGLIQYCMKNEEQRLLNEADYSF